MLHWEDRLLVTLRWEGALHILSRLSGCRRTCSWRIILSKGAGRAVKLCVDVRRLSRPLLSTHGRNLFRAVTVAVIVLSPASASWAYSHQTSKVRFREYSPEAFETARREGKPVFLLISAVWCYWCKYFHQNTLGSDEVSTYLNRNYLSIFVDYDRHTDLTRKYARGLPTIVLFDPDGQVRQSFAGVLKKEDFLDVLNRVANDVRTNVAAGQPRKPRIEPLVIPDPVPVTRETYQQLHQGMLDFLNDHLDPVHGGFGRREKYPHARLLRYLLAQYDAARDRHYLVAVERSLDGILRGLYDPVEGGFFRYAEGREWRPPHYEKLLDVNASLALVFSETYRVTQNLRYKEAAEATVTYLRRTLYDAKGGGFYGSQTADPAYYGLTPLARRTARKPPVNRDKVTAWNAEAALTFLMLSESAGRKDLVDVALRTLDFMRRDLITEKGVFQLYEFKTGRGQLPGQLEANAWAALAFLEGYRVSQAETYRHAAEQVLGYAKAELFDTAHGVFVDNRDSSFSLGANGIMAEALIRAHRLSGRAEDLEIAKRVLAALGGVAHALLVEDADAAAVTRVADAVFYLAAYGRVAGKPLDGGR